jgi:hypothetical protein
VSSAHSTCTCVPSDNPTVVGACACPLHGMKALRNALVTTLAVLGCSHLVEEGPNAGWRDGEWHDDDVSSPNCPVCAAEKVGRGALR